MNPRIWATAIVITAAVATGALTGRTRHTPSLPPAIVPAASAAEMDDIWHRPATFEERWWPGGVTFNERWRAQWDAKPVPTERYERDGTGYRPVATDLARPDTLTPTDRAIVPPRAVSHETPVKTDICTIHHMHRVNYDNGRRWRCRR